MMQPIEKCYISGKISGLAKEIYEELFAKAELRVMELGYQPVNPCKIDPKVDSPSWGDYMRADIKEMMDCSAIYVLTNWMDSRGANIEVQLAKDLGISIIFQQHSKP